jgi:hypothetical protein
MLIPTTRVIPTITATTAMGTLVVIRTTRTNDDFLWLRTLSRADSEGVTLVNTGAFCVPLRLIAAETCNHACALGRETARLRR